MAIHRTEKRHITITYDYAVNVRVPKTTGSGRGRGGQRDDEEMRRFILQTLRHELTREGQR